MTCTCSLQGLVAALKSGSDTASSRVDRALRRMCGLLSIYDYDEIVGLASCAIRDLEVPCPTFFERLTAVLRTRNADPKLGSAPGPQMPQPLFRMEPSHWTAGGTPGAAAATGQPAPSQPASPPQRYSKRTVTNIMFAAGRAATCSTPETEAVRGTLPELFGYLGQAWLQGVQEEGPVVPLGLSAVMWSYNKAGVRCQPCFGTLLASNYQRAVSSKQGVCARRWSRSRQCTTRSWTRCWQRCQTPAFERSRPSCTR